MSTHLQHELERLKKRILSLAAVSEEAVLRATRAVVDRNPALAEQVIVGDTPLDAAEVEIEEECLKLLALYQPVATDLRFIVTVLKINNDLERVGDLAVNIAERARHLCRLTAVAVPFDFDGMRGKALKMLRQSLDALVGRDASLARVVRGEDDEVDAANREMYAGVIAATRKNPEHIEALLSYLAVCRHLERIADYATNIAEDVIYLVEGRIIRHQAEDPAEGI